MQTLSHEEAKAFYDRFGAKQDSQSFYEDPALADLVAHADFERARSVFEFGCGTGRLADRLLSDHLPPDCRYRAVDISSTMVRLAGERLACWGDRAHVERTSGAMSVPAPDASADRFVATYVFDLLSESDIRLLLAEAGRVLKPHGLLCTVGLTRGVSPSGRLASLLWRALFRLSPKLVGGCRPVVVQVLLDGSVWSLRYRTVVQSFGISSEVLVTERAAPGRDPA